METTCRRSIRDTARVYLEYSRKRVKYQRSRAYLVAFGPPLRTYVRSRKLFALAIPQCSQNSYHHFGRLAEFVLGVGYIERVLRMVNRVSNIVRKRCILLIFAWSIIALPLFAEP